MAAFAVIDVGTNSIKMHVGRAEAGRVEVLADLVEVTRLGQGLHEANVLTPDAIERSAAAIRGFTAKGRALGVDEFAVVGTMALRRARNAGEFLRRVRRECGLDVEIIDGEEEARLSWRAVSSGLGAPRDRTLVFDAGGGSTEIAVGGPSGIERRSSIEVGCRRPTEEFLRSDPVAPAELQALFTYLRGEFRGLGGDVGSDVGSVVGIGGTVTTLGAVMLSMTTYDSGVIQGTVLPLPEVKRQVGAYRAQSIAERRQIPGLLPERADVILAGAALVQVILQELGVDELTISDRGLRHGVFEDRFAGRGSGSPPLAPSDKED